MQLRKLIALVASTLAASGAFAGTLTASNNATGFSINTVVNNSFGALSSITFDLRNTHTSDGSHLVIDGLPSSMSGPAATFSANASNDVFSFSFVSYSSGPFSFTWDPDSAINGSYGAVANPDLVGTIVTAVSNGQTLQGTMAYDGRSLVIATLAPVPEPETFAMMIAGIGLLGAAARRRRATIAS
ncbi:MAG: PEPxxWA-CTERM sorting domain-containing protein [Rhodocyclaceae bacterium]|nr:PEPxxWA-CTERM sorting domain-containing protein [Rhodocyclaceae bacterium]